VSAIDWSKSYRGAAARAEIGAYFDNCRRLLDDRRIDDAEHSLSRGRWRAAVDLSGVPSAVIDSTDGLCADAIGLCEYGDPGAIDGVLLKILDLWHMAPPVIPRAEHVH
jgi:hypothetical protein